MRRYNAIIIFSFEMALPLEPSFTLHTLNGTSYAL